MRSLPLTFTARSALAIGLDAADLVDAERASALPPIILVKLDPPPPAVRADERPKGIPSGVHHDRLVERLRAELAGRSLMADAAFGWRDTRTGDLVTVSVGDLAADIWYDLLEDDGISLGHVTDVLGVMSSRDRKVRRADLIGGLTGKPATAAGAAALTAWVRAVTGKEDPTVVRVIAHWLWLVKRLASGQRTEWDIMPIVFGTAHGSGKSTATERLVAPWAELATTINASTLTDDRKYRSLGVYVVGRWEEMSGAARAEIEALKHTVTAPTLNYRELHTHTDVVLRRTCSFIGSSNNPIDTMVADTTGARRFFQVDALPKLDHQLVNAIDYGALWEAVSEADPAPIHDVIHVVRAAQAELVHRDAVSMWLDQEGWGRLSVNQVDTVVPLEVPPYLHTQGEPFEHLAARFKHWCNRVGQSGLGVIALAKRLRQEGFTEGARVGKAGTRRPRMFHRPAARSETAPGDHATPAPDSPAGAPDTKPSRGERMMADPAAGEDVLGDGKYAFD